ncbi:hypothetical protein F5Y05DRAFT_376517 [Hypoxylon sp. FL0543]|nr:hypothetical protein F5Y05DRAFT_376517 [Hypoxylon sp. FL0543]
MGVVACAMRTSILPLNPRSDMMTATPNDPAIICAERIAALHFLHHVPVPPSSNPVTDIHRRSAGYTLPFEKERGLASTLAFLAYPKDNVDYVPAVCLEEVPDAVYLNVLLAVNRPDQSSGRQHLEELKEKFERIFSLLGKFDVDSPNIEGDVFKAIISICSMRILERLRLQGSKIYCQSIEKALQRAYEHLKHSERKQFKRAGLLTVLGQFIEKASEVLRLVKSWAGYQTELRLEELVEGIYRLRRVGDLGALFENGHIPNQVMNPDLRKSLLNMILKVARYREAARLLYRMGKKFPLARNMRVVAVEWSEEVFRRTSNSAYVPRLETTISMTRGLKNREKNLQHICQLLNRNEKEASRKETSEKASDKFSRRTQETLREARIHAEIQLLYYCELKVPRERLPRVVCSSKDACWLCNEFILLYEKIYMPKSHGRLHPGWRLPGLRAPGLDDLAERYNQRLHESLRDSLKRLFGRTERTRHPIPNESTVLTLYLSDTTLSSVSLPLSDNKGKGVVEVVQDMAIPSQEAIMHGTTPVDDEESKGTTKEVEEIEEVRLEDCPTAPEQGLVHQSTIANDEKSKETLKEAEEVEGTPETSTSPGQEPAHDPNLTQIERNQETTAELEETEAAPEASTADDDEISEMPEFSASSSSAESSSPSERYFTLTPGEVRHQRIKIGKTTPIYKAGSMLDLQLEYASGPSLLTPDGHRKKLSYAIERLRPEDVESLQSRGVVPIVGAELPEYWIDGNTDEAGCVYIANGGVVLRLLMRPGSNQSRDDEPAGAADENGLEDVEGQAGRC